MNITGGKYNRQRIIAPDENITRPTLSKVRMGVFNSLNSMMDFEGKSFLDMFAGSAIMGLEAISRGFENVCAIEKNKKVYNIAKLNISNYIDNHEIKLILGDSINVCKKLMQKFDVIYIDPPYHSGIYEKSLDSIEHIASNIVVLEHVENIVLNENFVLIKQKKYSDKYISFLQRKLPKQ